MFWGRLAEIVGEYLKKGSQVYVEGKLETKKFQDKETGKDRYSTQIRADQMRMLGARPEGGQQRETEPESRPEPKPSPKQPAKKPVGKFDDMQDDIPF